nr:MAG TPA: hypothetical protein [Caudoviricetes sp.]
MKLATNSLLKSRGNALKFTPLEFETKILDIQIT